MINTKNNNNNNVDEYSFKAIKSNAILLIVSFNNLLVKSFCVFFFISFYFHFTYVLYRHIVLFFTALLISFDPIGYRII